MNPDRWFDVALRCYPAWWQERYAGEVRTVADDLRSAGRNPARIVVDLVVGMVRVRRNAVGMPRTYRLWNARTRQSVATATLPFVLLAPFVLAGVGYTGLRAKGGTVFYSGFLFPRGLMRFGRTGPLPAPPLTPAATLIFWAEGAIMVLALLTLFAVLYGWGNFVAAVRNAAPGQSRWTRALGWTPALVVVAFIGLTALASRFTPHGWIGVVGHPSRQVGGNPALFRLTHDLAQVALVGGWLLSVATIAVLARRYEMTPFDLRVGARVSSIMAILAVLMGGALAAWGAGVFLQAHQAGHGTFTVVEFVHPSLWPLSAAAALLACTLSISGATRARRGYRMVAELGN
jgi:hypothetical protein